MTASFDIMSDKLITISQNDFLKSAYKIMHEKGIRHLPVTGETGKIVGIISDRDVKLAMKRIKSNDNREVTYQFNSEELVKDYMHQPVMAVLGSESIAYVAKKMLAEKISALLVADEKNKISGIITTDDLLAYLASSLADELKQPHQEMGIVHLLNAGQYL